MIRPPTCPGNRDRFKGDIVVDVGAHLGVLAIYLAKKFPFITVYALEPDPNNYECLQRNIDINRVTNVVAINKALSGVGQSRVLYSDLRTSSWATISASVASSSYSLRTWKVETVTLEEVFQEYRIPHCRMLKISALGAVRESIEAFSHRGRIDFLCGEVDLKDCSQARLETVSQKIARHHFWRTFDSRPGATCDPWIHQAPSQIERSPKQVLSWATDSAVLSNSKS